MSCRPLFHLRDADIADTSAIRTLALRAFRTAAPEWATGPASEDEWLVWLPNFFQAPLASQFLLVAESNDGELWGMSHVLPVVDPLAPESHPHLESLAVAESAEGRGVASALIEACAERARQQGGKELSLHVYVGNSRARAVYEHLGFQPDWLRLRRSLD